MSTHLSLAGQQLLRGSEARDRKRDDEYASSPVSSWLMNKELEGKAIVDSWNHTLKNNAAISTESEVERMGCSLEFSGNFK